MINTNNFNTTIVPQNVCFTIIWSLTEIFLECLKEEFVPKIEGDEEDKDKPEEKKPKKKEKKRSKRMLLS
jgi:hypothetical protein